MSGSYEVAEATKKRGIPDGTENHTGNDMEKF